MQRRDSASISSSDAQNYMKAPGSSCGAEGEGGTVLLTVSARSLSVSLCVKCCPQKMS